jgi:hypothetical protein
MADTALLKEIGRMLRGHYTTLTEEPLPEYLMEIVERFPTDPHGPQATGGVDEASAASLPPPGATFSTPP